jgi:hypothetical protein
MVLNWFIYSFKLNFPYTILPGRFVMFEGSV